MSYNVQQEDIDILFQQNLNIEIKIEILNENKKIINELQADTISGSISEDANSDVRRTANLTFHLINDSYLIGEDKNIWFTRYIRPIVKIKNSRTKNFRSYNLGIFLFNETSYTYDEVTQNLSVNCLDLMCNLNGTMNGQFRGLDTKIPVDSDIRQTLTSILEQFGKIKEYSIDDINKEIPYDLQFSSESTVYELLNKIRDLYSGWEFYFDENGVFVYKKIPTLKDDNIVLDSVIMNRLVKSVSASIKMENVRNVIDLWGKCLKADRYTDTSTYSNNTYSITFDNFILDNNMLIGFKVLNDSPSSSLKINDLSAYPIQNEDGSFVNLESGKSYVVKYKNNVFYYQGEYQIHYIVKEVSQEPTIEQKQNDYNYEGTKNIKYIVNKDSPFTVDKIKEKRKKCVGNDYDKIYTEDLARQRAEYELWKSTRLEETLNIQMLLVPWLNVNQKIEYTFNGITSQYIIKKVDKDFTNWMQSVELIKFYPLYPFIVNE